MNETPSSPPPSSSLPPTVETSSEVAEAWLRNLENVLGFLQGYWREAIVICVVVVGGMILYAYAREGQERAEREAWDAICHALCLAESPSGMPLAKEMASVREKHANTHAVFYAYVKEIRALAESGGREQLERAMALSQQFLDRFGSHPFAYDMRLERAKMLTHLGRWSEARREVALVLEAKEAAHLEPEARLVEAQALAQEGKREAASLEFRKIQTLGQERGWPLPILEEAAFSLALLEETSVTPKGGPTITSPTPPTAPPSGDSAAVIPLASPSTQNVTPSTPPTVEPSSPTTPAESEPSPAPALPKDSEVPPDGGEKPSSEASPSSQGEVQPAPPASEKTE